MSNDAFRIGAASAIGAVIGGMIGYVLLTDRGRSKLRELGPAIDSARDELISLARSLEGAGGTARDGLQWFNRLVADSGFTDDGDADGRLH